MSEEHSGHRQDDMVSEARRRLAGQLALLFFLITCGIWYMLCLQANRLIDNNGAFGAVAPMAVVALLASAMYGFAASPYSVDRALRHVQRKDKEPVARLEETVCIVGAGISGLYAAYKLQKHCKLVVLERSGAPGGNNRSSPVEAAEVPVQYGCSGLATSPLLTGLVEELGLHRERCKQNVAALVDGELEFKRYDSEFSSPNRHSKLKLFAWTRSYPVLQQIRFVAWWMAMHFLYYFYPMQDWSADDILLQGNTGVDDVFVPQCGINVFVDRCELKSTPYTYFLRYAALYFGRTFFCIREGNHELIRRLYAKLKGDCNFQFHASASSIEGEEGRFFVNLASGSRLGPFHQVVLACPPHQAPSMLPSAAIYDTHRELCSQFEHVVARSCVHSDPTPFEKAADPALELGVMYERSTGNEEHHYLHINPAQFYNIEGIPKHCFVTVSYGAAFPNDVVKEEKTMAYYDSTLSRLKVSAQRSLPPLLKKVAAKSGGIHLCSAAQLGLMWHEDGLMMAQRAAEATIRALRRLPSASAAPDDSKSLQKEDNKQPDTAQGDIFSDTRSTVSADSHDRQSEESSTDTSTGALDQEINSLRHEVV